jgi:hypothetical protein
LEEEEEAAPYHERAFELSSRYRCCHHRRRSYQPKFSLQGHYRLMTSVNLNPIREFPRLTFIYSLKKTENCFSATEMLQQHPDSDIPLYEF